MREVYLQPVSPAQPPAAEGGIAITHFPFVLGRNPECDYHLTSPMASRRHCAFFVRRGEVWLADLESRNGTYLNGQPVHGARPLHDGAFLTLADLQFQIRLPALPGAPAVSPTGLPPRKAPAGRPHNVLIVEDNPDAAEALALLLQTWGHHVHVARDGAEALQAARVHQPDTVLLDIRLPRLDGYQVAERLRTQEGHKKTLVVGITGYERDGEEGRSREAGLDYLFTKPVSPSALQEVLTYST